MLGAFLALLNTPEEKTRFEHLYLENRSIMYNYAMEILKDSQLAEDAVQDAFMKLIKYMDHIKGRNDHDARNYLIIIVKNEARQIYNQRKNVVYQEDMTGLDWDYPDVEHLVESKEEKRHIMDLIKSIGSKYGEPLILRFYYEFKDKEVAAMLGISLENEKIRVHRGSEMVKKLLEREKAHDGEPV